MTEQEYQVAMAELGRLAAEFDNLERTANRIEEILNEMFARLEMERPSDNEA